MRIVIEYRDGKTEIIRFECEDPYPQTVSIRRVVGANAGEPEYEERVFHRDRWLRGGRPVYTEDEPPVPRGAA